MTDDCLRKIRSLLSERKVVLFLGAGTSVAAGGPTGKELTDEFRQKFPGADANDPNLFDVCQDIKDTPGNNLQDMEDYVKQRLRKLQPSKWHRILAKQNWKAIFTTNYDTLVEKSYDEPDALRECVPIQSSEFVNPFIELDKVHLYKLMGSISDKEPGASMILTRSQYHDNLTKRAKTFELLFDLVQNGTVIFVGYSGKDRILLDIMEKVLEKRGPDRLAWSYSINNTEVSDEDKRKLALKKIIPIKMSFEDLMDYLEATPAQPLSNTLPPDKGITLKIKNIEVVLNADYAFECEKQFEILNDESMQGDIPKEDFFRGVTRSWVPYERGWDFKREIYDNSGYVNSKVKTSLLERVRQEMSRPIISENRAIVLKGPPGSGKSIVAKRLAYQSYKDGNPVIWIDPTKSKLDFKFLSAFVEDLMKLYQKNNGDPSSLKVLIVIDDNQSSNINPLRLGSFLTSSGRSALIVSTERDSDFDEINNHPSKNDIYEINQNLNEYEKEKFMGHLAKLGFVGVNDSWKSYLSLGIESSFFAALYTLVHPSRQPLDKIIQNQYDNLPKELKKLYSYISAFHQFNLTITQELLVRAMKCSYDEFFTQINSPEAQGIVFDEYTPLGQSYYMTHHPIMAAKTMEFAYPFPEHQSHLFKELLSDVNLSNEKEKQLVEVLFAKHLSSKSRSTDLTIDMKRDLIKLVCEQKESRGLLHHWAILETDAGNFQIAEGLFKRALQIPASIDGYRGESDQNILTSLGRMFSKMAVKALQEKSSSAETLFSKAERTFVSARSNGFPSVHSFHHHAYLYLNRYEHEPDKILGLEWLAKAMDIIAKAEDAIDDLSLLPIKELRARAYSYFHDEKEIAGIADEIGRKYNNGKGYYIYASYILKKGQDHENLLKASAIVDNALARFPRDDSLLSLKLTIAMAISGSRPEAFYESLKEWYSTASEHNPKHLYFLAVAAFRQEHYEDSRRYFDELNELSLGHQNRTKFQYSLLDEKGNRKDFRGVVHSISTGSTGSIICTDLINLKYPIGFRPTDCRFYAVAGSRVIFNISFSMIGPRATNVRKG